MEKYLRARKVTDDNIIRRMRTACCIFKATDTHTHTHTQYVMKTACFYIFFVHTETLKVSNHLVDLDVDGRITFKLILHTYGMRM